jgi:anti-sigma-K factor RskA
MNEKMEELMLDLLCKKAEYGLSEADEKKLAELRSDAGVPDDSASFELTAAAIGLAYSDAAEELPSSLRSRIVADAERYFEGRPEKSSERASEIAPENAGTGSWFGWLGWAFAAAACLALAFNFYYSRPQNDLARNGQPTPTPEERLTPAQLRLRLIESAPDLARGTWAAGNVKDVTPAGDIVWSDTKQAGYMRLTGLPVNDPNRETYQLWIFDETQDDKTPIDGGTFNVTSDGEVIVPIDPKLRPRNTKMYAITVEQPEGVVVSDRKRLIALAKRET